MKSFTIFVFLILTASLVFGSSQSLAFAQDNPHILKKIAEGAKNQIQSQITSSSSEEIKNLFQEGQSGVLALENALANDDLTAAREHFLSTMKIFTKISHLLTTQPTSPPEPKPIPSVPNPSSDLHRMQSYVTSLKAIAKNQNSSMDFSLLDNLFSNARNQINNYQYEEATQTIQEIKEAIIDYNAKLRQQASHQETNRAQDFAQKYLDRLDRLIDHGQKTGMSEDIIQILSTSRQSLSMANTPSEVVNEVRKILLLQQQYEISEKSLLELRIQDLEKSALEITNSEQFNEEFIEGINKNISTIKDHLDNKEFERATVLLNALVSILEKIQI